MITHVPALLAQAAAAAQPTSSFRALDMTIVGVYLLILVVTGVLFSRREQKNTADYFLASRRMPMWAVAVSIIATSLSAATFLGAPQSSYDGNMSYLLGLLGMLFGVVIVAKFFIPVFYRLNVTSIYELLEHRFGPEAKRAASLAFMVGRLFASGARIYICAIPLAMIIWGVQGSAEPVNLIYCILALSAVGVFYTLIGGIASVIWTDVIQTCVMVVAVIAAIVMLLHKIPAPTSEIVSALQTAGPGGSSKLDIFVSGFDKNHPLGINFQASFTILTALLGLTLLNAASMGCDHDMTQRMLTCKNAVQGARSVLMSIVIALPIVTLFLVIGLLLFAFYKRPDLMGAALPTYDTGTTDRVFLTFIIREMPAGFAGLMIAGLFAVGIGSLNSAINAMAATTIADFYQHYVKGKSEAHYLSASRWATIGWGALLALFAIVCVYWQLRSPSKSLLDLALGVMSFAYSGLLAVFCAALFTKRGSSASVIGALVVGFAIVLLLQGFFWNRWTLWIPGLASQDPGTGALIPPKPLAFAWHMTIATPIAFLVCIAAKGRSGGPRTI